MTTESRRPLHLLTWSGGDQAELDAATAALVADLRARGDAGLAERSTSAGAHRRALVAATAEEALGALDPLDSKRVVSGVAASPSVTFLFSGQGAQYPGMARGVYEAEPAFRAAVDRSCELLRSHLGRDLRELLFPSDADREAVTATLNETRYTQPALFVIEHATATLWTSRGVRPAAMLGHSIGEYVAATIAGVMDVESALALVAARGRLMWGLPPGGMLAVPLTEDRLQPYLDPTLSLAATNAANRLVVSGPHESIASLAAKLSADKVMATQLHTSHAFHSVMMEPILDEFRAIVAAVELRAPQIPYVSNLTGTWITPEQATDPGYYPQHLRQAVRFAEGVTAIFERDPEGILLEVGPGKTLVTLSQRHPARQKTHRLLASIRHPKDDLDDQRVLLETAGQMWVSGVGVEG